MRKNLFEKRQNKRGIAMFSALFVMIILSALVLQFHYMSRQAQSTAFRFQTSEVARQLAESAVDEAFMRIYKETANAESELAKKLITKHFDIDCTRHPNLKNKNNTGINIPVENTINEAKNMGVGARMDIEVKARIIDFRNQDSAGGKYYNNEGVGTLELRVKVSPKPKYEKQIRGKCVIERHHDYKVMCMTSKLDNTSEKTEYAQNFLLDYALFIRDGKQEFKETSGRSLNPTHCKIRIDQRKIPATKRGKLYVGGEGTGPLFIDMGGDTTDFIPEPHNASFKEFPVLTANHEECLKIVKGFRDELKKAAEQAVRSKGAKPREFKCWGLKGHFGYRRYPMSTDYIDGLTDEKGKPETAEFKNRIKYAMRGAWSENKEYNSKQTGNGEYLDPQFISSFEVLPKESLTEILRGDLRKRYFHFGFFYMDTSSAGFSIGWKKKKGFKTYRGTEVVNLSDDRYKKIFAKSYYPCFRAKADIKTVGPIRVDYDYINEQYGPKSNKQFPNAFDPNLIFTKLADSYPLNKSNEEPADPKFYNYRTGKMVSVGMTGGSGFLPYAHVNLWSRRNLNQKMLEEYGIYDRKTETLYLRGIIHMEKPLTLGKVGGKDITIKGRGVIIAPDTTINVGIKKSKDEDLLVICTRGYPIWIRTDHEIAASLVAIGRNAARDGTVIANKKLNLKGALVVGRLNNQRWKSGVTHEIKYDEQLRTNEDTYQINLSRWVTFERMVENDE